MSGSHKVHRIFGFRKTQTVILVVLVVIMWIMKDAAEARSVENLRVMRPGRSDGSYPTVSVISKNSWLEQGLKPMPSSYYRKKSKKVDTQKFRQCIFFQLCSKSECFHYGRYNTCS